MKESVALGAVDSFSLRARYRAFIARHDIAWEISFAALAVVFVAIAFVPVGPGSPEQAVFEALEWLITGIFTAEFGSRLWAASDRRSYVRGHWIDLVALIPPVRWLRPIRLLRLLRLVRAFAGVGRALAGVERLGRHRGLVWLLVAWAAVMILTSIGLYAAENGVNEAVNDPLDALWWGITTMTTVGYGDIYPVTPEGRIAAAVLMILGIGLYSAITATVASFLIASSGPEPRVADRIRDLAKLRDEGLIDDETFAEKRAALLDRL
jgi:voltage-gated potassium channel